MPTALPLISEKGNNKKKIITTFFYNRNFTIPELSKELNLSIPTISKLVNELVEEGTLTDFGKSESKSGRKPSTYGLNPHSGYFLGIDIKKNHINLGISNFNGEIVKQDLDIPCVLSGKTMDELNEICRYVDEFTNSSGIPRNKILNACVNVGGRVNPTTGYSYSLFNFSENPLSDILSEKLGLNVCIENDTRSMAYGECLQGLKNGEKDVLYINLGWGLGLGIIINGAIYEGKSGFAGEFGHIHVFDNEIICHCGKIGCLETEVSGMALQREIVNSIREGKASTLSHFVDNNEEITLSDILESINNEDFLSIDILESIGEKLGKQLANLINIFNPELVIIGGTLSAAGDYLLQPIRQAVKKHSLKLVNGDSRIICSKLNEKAGIIGACMTARRLMFEKIV